MLEETRFGCHGCLEEVRAVSPMYCLVVIFEYLAGGPNRLSQIPR